LSQERPDIVVLPVDQDDPISLLQSYALRATAVIHLAGVNRPVNPSEFMTGNADFTQSLIKFLQQHGRTPSLLLASSIQAASDNSYGASKLRAENIVSEYGCATGSPIFIYRLPNVFGKWCRPNYNSAIATFCHNLANGLPVQIHNPAQLLSLVYIDDVVQEFICAIDGQPSRQGNFCAIPITHEASVGEILKMLTEFASSRQSLAIPDQADPFIRKLYSTYLSYLPDSSFSYPLTMHRDARGSFTEVFRTMDRGQISINISNPGITKGNHWHHSKHEKFLVVSGQGVIRLRKFESTEIREVQVSNKELRVVEIPPGYTHNITNLGTEEMVTLMWANEAFDKNRPDTWIESV
jgi:UDP-2-acetamido-2,6-beta-L-arabino-hexul-4-ose reductase